MDVDVEDDLDDDEEEDDEAPIHAGEDGVEDLATEKDPRPLLRCLAQNHVFTQRSLLKRRKKLGGSALGIRQLHYAHLVAHAPLKIPERQCSAPFDESSNLGDTIAGIDLPDLDGNEWKVKHEIKHIFTDQTSTALQAKHLALRMASLIRQTEQVMNQSAGGCIPCASSIA